MAETPEEPTPPEPPEPFAVKPEPPRNRTLEWFSKNPVFGLIGLLVGVVSLIATVYFGWISVKDRDLSLTVNPTSTTIVKAGQSSDLHILYKGQSVATDVTGFQVGMWNAGRESIRPEHILSPIILQTSPKVPILEVRLKHTSRPVCDIVLDDSHLEDGKVGLSWRILEHNDGAVVQFIVAGPSNATVVGLGSVEGDGIIRTVKVLKGTFTDLFLYLLGVLAGVIVAGGVAFLIPSTGTFAMFTNKVKYRILLGSWVLGSLLGTVLYFLVYTPMPLQFD